MPLPDTAGCTGPPVIHPSAQWDAVTEGMSLAVAVPPGALQITGAAPNPALLDLPWDTPLEEWPTSYLAALPRGISRHVVRFVRFSGVVLAVKEIA